MKTIIASLVVVAVAAGGLLVYVKYVAGSAPPNYRTATVKVDELLPTISATGTLEPEETIDIGAQVTGMIQKLGDDPGSPTKRVDYGSQIEQGTVLAIIDPTLYKAQVDQAEATLRRAQADLEQMFAKRDQAKADLKRADELIGTKAIAQSDYDAAVANYRVAEANVGVDRAAIVQAQAALDLAKTNLGYTTIKSPVKGVVIDRRVNVGQTVVSAMTTSSLFLLAKDLSRIQVWASVNEADIGRIHVGQNVRFTVDARPNETFVGKVIQIRLNATMTQNVVTYTVVIETDNSSMKLFPFLTANVQFELEHHEGVLVVPNAALRWTPRPQQIAPEMRDKALAKSSGKGGKGSKHEDSKDGAPAAAPGGDAKAPGGETKPPAGDATSPPKADGQPATSGGTAANREKMATALKAEAGRKATGNPKPATRNPRSTEAPIPAKAKKPHEDRGRIWVKEGNFVRPVDVKVVATDGIMTEVSGKEVQEGLEVVIGENVNVDDGGDTTNPFAPKFFKGKGR